MSLMEKSLALLKDELRLDATKEGLEKCFDVWKNQKSYLLELFRNHPNWDEDNYRIELSAKFTRGIDRSATKKFSSWAYNKIRSQVVEDNKIKLGMVSVGDAFKIRDSLWSDISNYRGCLFISKQTRERMEEEYKHYKNLCKRFSNNDEYKQINGEYITHNDYQVMISAQNVVDYICYYCTQFFNEDNVENIKREIKCENSDFPEPTVGMKSSKYVGRVCKFVGIDNIIDMQLKTWTSDDGTQHEREVDEGYNKQFAAFADAINPLAVEEKLYVSLNPIDFWTASFGNGWGSCYHIDIHNTRRSVSNRYSGQYCAGTSAYMMDATSFIAYTEGNCEEWGDYTKKNRCMFAFGEDKLFQSKVYPNGGEGDYADQLRNIVQDLIANLLGRESSWRLKRNDYSSYYSWGENGNGYGYNDYSHQYESNVSLLKDADGNINENKIVISCHPVSITNGKPLDNNESIEDYRLIECEHCGNEIDTDTDDYIRIDGHYYCCASCASDADYVYTRDTNNWLSVYNAYFTEDTQEYYEYNDDLYYSDYCREYYANPDNLIWCEFDDDYVASDDDCLYDAYKEECFIKDIHDYIEVKKANGDKIFFINSNNAEQYGCHYCEVQGIWYPEDEVEYDDWHKDYIPTDGLIKIRYYKENKECVAYFIDLDEAIGDQLINDVNEVVETDEEGVYNKIRVESEVA